MKIKNIYLAISASAAMFALSTTHSVANDITVEEAYSKCGIGAAIFPNNETAATISNVIWDLGTTAYSSATSSPDSCAGAKVTAAQFIQETYPVVEEQFVKGDGQHITALMNILGCDQASHSTIVSQIQKDLTVSFQNASYATNTRTQKSSDLARSLDKAIASCNV